MINPITLDRINLAAAVESSEPSAASRPNRLKAIAPHTAPATLSGMPPKKTDTGPATLATVASVRAVLKSETSRALGCRAGKLPGSPGKSEVRPWHPGSSGFRDGSGGVFCPIVMTTPFISKITSL